MSTSPSTSSLSAAPSPHPDTYLPTLQQQGFLILRDFLPAGELAALRRAAANLTAVARAGGWPHVRTVGKQFPPWDDDAPAVARGEAGIWGVQHLLHPDLPVGSEADRAEFVRLYFGERILRVAGEGILRTRLEDDDDGGELVMELMNMLVRPEGPRPAGNLATTTTTTTTSSSGEEGDKRAATAGGFALRWHRDDIPATATPSEELSRLGPGLRGEYVHTQWNLPLYDDDSLVVVPGSHRRARTRLERDADPYADPLPGQVRVGLRAGDVVFYDNNMLHRGVYDAGRERLTLHGSVGHARGSRDRARNVLQHGVGEWVDRCDFSVLGDGPERRRAEGMRRRLVEMGRENAGKDVGYSLEG